MPQTRFVVQKALSHGLRPIVVVNKVDRPDARPDDVVNEVFDLLVDLGAKDSALDFPVIYASAKEGWATEDLGNRGSDLRVIPEAIVKHVPPPPVRPGEPLRLLVSTLDWSEYVGRIAIGRILSGTIEEGSDVAVIQRDGTQKIQRVAQLFDFEGLRKTRTGALGAGEVCAVVGLDPIHIGDTIADAEEPGSLETIPVDEPTLHVTFRVNDGPFSGREGKFVTSRQIRDRLMRELQSNVALRVVDGDSPEEFKVSGRGLMHIGILLENLRREGYELTVGKPRVITREIDGKLHEPYELMVVDVPLNHQSNVMSLVGDRRAELIKMDPKPGAQGYVHMEFEIPARGLMGLRSKMLTATQGQAILYHSFLRWRPVAGTIPQRASGVMVATETGRTTAYALDALTDRGMFFVTPGDNVYLGQIVGEHCRDKDIAVNVVKAKKLTNYRASGRDDAAKVRPVRLITLEGALEYVQEDELVEVTPNSIRLRKRTLNASERKRQSRNKVEA